MFQVVTDEGLVFGTSRVFVESLMKGSFRKGFVLLSKLPFSVSPERFGKSKLWNPGGSEVSDNKEVEQKDDDFSPKVAKEAKVSAGFKKEVVL